MPFYDFLCSCCGYLFESSAGVEEKRIDCSHCETPTADRLPPLIGGYSGNLGPSSTRPKNSTSMARATVFTGNKKDE